MLRGMNRRSFISALAPGAAVTAVATNLPAPQPHRVNEPDQGNILKAAGVEVSDRRWNPYINMHGDWWIYWTGWKQSVHMCSFVGQWIAVLHDANNPTRRAYSSVPGGYGFFCKGEAFDISVRDHQYAAEYVTEFTSSSKRLIWEANALDVLLQLINMPEPIRPTINSTGRGAVLNQKKEYDGWWDGLSKEQQWLHTSLASVQLRRVSSDPA